MSYLVLARKWRPQVFEDVVGQGHITKTLQNAISSGRIAHAYLFSGPRGVGKTTVARILAKALNCVKGPTPTPCNDCQRCKGITSGFSVDVLEIDGASNTGVDNVRELRENIRYLPSQGGYRVYIIDEVHMLSVSAFNALLKTLEEPPSHAVFVFATTEVYKIPRTVLSRCQRFDFRRIPLKDIQAHTMHIAESEGIDIDDMSLYLIAREAEGSMRDALGFLDQVVSYAGAVIRKEHVLEALGLMDRAFLHQIAEGILREKGGDCLNVIEKVFNFGYDIKRFCQELLEYIRDLVIVKAVEEPKGLLDLPDSEVEGLRGLSELVSFPHLQMMFNILHRGYEEISRSTSPRFLLEMTVLRIAHLDKVQPLSTILEGLERLERDGGMSLRSGGSNSISA
ncbi:MAG: DNA polymerase III subunit gamma/tau, partial [Deltaproteobacteria bacterium]|nr:DNA polymerase III subunit gamma/tau [Deltaproteobacteria bacterium]